MKFILAAMCILVIAFSGGCALVSLAFGTAGIFLIPTVIAIALNATILSGLFGAKQAWKPAFYILAAIDFLVAVLGLFFLPSIISLGYSSGSDPSTTTVVALFVAGFLFKGGLTFYFASKLPAKDKG